MGLYVLYLHAIVGRYVLYLHTNAGKYIPACQWKMPKDTKNVQKNAKMQNKQKKPKNAKKDTKKHQKRQKSFTNAKNVLVHKITYVCLIFI